MFMPESFRHQHLNRLTKEFMTGIAEELLCLTVREHDRAGFVDDHMRIWGRFQQSAELLLCLLALSDVLGERHYEPRHVLGTWNEGNVVAHPNYAAILAPILLLDLKLFSLSFEQLGDELPVRFAIILMGKVQKSEFTDFLLGITQHFLIRRVGGQKAAVEVCEGDTDGRILKYCPPPLLALAQGLFGALTLDNFLSELFVHSCKLSGPFE